MNFSPPVSKNDPIIYYCAFIQEFDPSTIHPDLDKWMLQTGYGRVLSRPGLTPRLRELCVIAVLTGQNVTPQLFSHLRGAVNVGASVAECESVLKQTEFIWGAEAQAQAFRVFEKVRPKL